MTSIAPAVPSASGVADVFAFQNDGTVQAITAEGTTAWTANVSDSTHVAPDFQGGLVALEYNNGKGSVTKLDGKTGQRYPVYVPGGSSELDPWDLAVHTDGTIFAFQNNWSDWTVIGIDPATGIQKFGVSVPIPANAGYPCWGGVIVAGDGYAYIPFGWMADFAYRYMTNHLRVLRVSSSGASDIIPISDWSSDFSELCAMNIRVITNADKGIALTWQSDYSMNVGPRMAITNGTSVSVMNGPAVPGQTAPVAPVLQAEDGSFVGAVWTTDGSQNLVAFDAGGNVRWSLANYCPQIATAGGGVIATASSYCSPNSVPAVTLDQNGSATGQIGSLPTQSWTGNMYQRGSVPRVAVDPFILAAAFWFFRDANNSNNSAAAQPLPDRVKAIYDVVGPDPLGAGAKKRDINYLLYQGRNRFPPLKQAVIKEKLIYSWGRQQPQPSPSKPGQVFSDELGTRGQGDFNLTQQFFATLPGGRDYRVQIEPCIDTNKFGKPVWQNIVQARSQTVLINDDAGSTAGRKCEEE